VVLEKKGSAMKTPFPTRLLQLALVALVVAGCNQQTALIPPKIHYGLETCADCGMIINDSHYAAALAWSTSANAPEQNAIFDDIGCMLDWRQHHANARIMAAWVKDVHTGAWLNASSAIYVKNKRFQTPMGWGIVAGAATNEFSELAARQTLLTWAELLQSGTEKVQSTASANQETHNN